MIRLVRAEWTKLFTTRVWLGLVAGACVMVAGFSALLTAFAGSSQPGQPPLPGVGDPRSSSWPSPPPRMPSSSS